MASSKLTRWFWQHVHDVAERVWCWTYHHKLGGSQSTGESISNGVMDRIFQCGSNEPFTLMWTTPLGDPEAWPGMVKVEVEGGGDVDEVKFYRSYGGGYHEVGREDMLTEEELAAKPKLNLNLESEPEPDPSAHQPPPSSPTDRPAS